MESLLRQLAMLQQIPRYPRRVDTRTIQDRLGARGYEVTLRTIQRDLNSMAAVLPLQSDSSKPQGWSWAADAGSHNIPGLDPQTALVFRMVEEHMQALLPSSTLRLLEPWFKSARGVLAEAGKELGHWPDKIRVLPRGMPLLPPRVDALVQDRIYQGLLEEKQLRVAYLARNAVQPRTYRISPLAIVQRGDISNVVTTLGSRTEPRLLLLHRITAATLLDDPVSRPQDFDLDRYIADGELSYRVGPPIRLRAEFANDAASFLYDTPLSEDQVITETGAVLLVCATVPDTHELRGWLRGFGKKVTVIEPDGLLD